MPSTVRKGQCLESPARQSSQLAAACIYLANNALANECAISAVFDDADKLVSDRSIETRIPTRDLQIGVANA